MGSRYQKLRCLAVMDQLDSYKTFRFYRYPVDPIRDNCPDYFDVIAQPMDLGTVRKKLENDEYSTVSEWKSDVSLIWKNCMEYNQTDFVFLAIARQLSDTFTSLSQSITDDEERDWKNRLQKLEEKLRFLNSSRPDHLPKPRFTQDELEANRRISLDMTLTRNVTRGEQIPQYANNQYLSPDDIVKLVTDINGLEDEDDVTEVINLIRDCEPQLQIGNDVNLEIEDLRISTLVALQKLINKLAQSK